MNGAEEIASSFVVTGGDGTELLELGKKVWLIMRFGRLGQEGMEERFQQAFATNSGVVHELEEAQIEREFFL